MPHYVAHDCTAPKTRGQQVNVTCCPCLGSDSSKPNVDKQWRQLKESEYGLDVKELYKGTVGVFLKALTF